jgi:hypothetical protein
MGFWRAFLGDLYTEPKPEKEREKEEEEGEEWKPSPWWDAPKERSGAPTTRCRGMHGRLVGKR